MTTCPECGSPTREINLLPGPSYYAWRETKPSWVDGSIQRAGTVRSVICSGCHRISIYGIPEPVERAPEVRPAGSSLPIPADSPSLAAETLPRPADGVPTPPAQPPRRESE